jgi:AAA domain (dynein-related subfamily)
VTVEVEEQVVQPQAAQPVRAQRPVVQLPPGMSIPTADPVFALKGDTIHQIEAAIRRADNGEIVKLLLTGPHGTGKSSLARQVAAHRRSPFAYVSFGEFQEPKEILGDMKFTPEKGAYWEPGVLWRALQVPYAVVLMDEINRVENPKVHGPLFTLLQDHRYVSNTGEELVIAEGVLIVAAINEGYDYAGADNMDMALKGRFSQIEMEMPEPKVVVEVLSKKCGVPAKEIMELLVALGVTSSSKTLPNWMTMRGLIKCCEYMKEGLQWRLCVAMAFNTMEPGARNEVLAKMQTSRPNETPDLTYRAWS